MTRSGSSLAEAEQRVLGFQLEALTHRLVKDWHLGALLEQAVAGKHNPRVANVELGHAVAAAVEQFGWNSAEVRQTVDKVAVHLGVPRAAAEELVQANVEEAAEIATRYGVPAVESYLLENEHLPGRRGPDTAVQLDTLKRIADHLDGEVDLDAVVRLVLSGIHRGLGLSRTFFALLSPDRSSLQVRRVSGPRAGDVRASSSPDAVIPLHTTPGKDLFRAALESGKLVQVTEDNSSSMQALFTDAIRRWAAVPFVIIPVITGGRAAGLLYADNATDGRPIDAESLSGLRHFGQQISLALTRQGQQ
jgi:hypothetical protein